MERDYGKAIDELTKKVAEISEIQAQILEKYKDFIILPKEPSAEQLDELKEQILKGMPNKPSTEKLERVYVMHGMHPDPRMSELMEKLCRGTEADNVSGQITYLGVYNSGGRQSNWIRNEVSTDGLLSLIESGMAGKVLACIGNANRLSILLAILRAPKTVAELVEECGLGSTGQAYHHMKPLLAADLIVEDEYQKGAYIVQPHKVQGIIMLLAGISDMVDETLTQSAWETPEEA